MRLRGMWVGDGGKEEFHWTGGRRTGVEVLRDE
jgi:hypothetical protein